MQPQPPEQAENNTVTMVTYKSRPESDKKESAVYQPIAVSKRLYLREVRQADVNDRYYKWMNDPEITRYLETRYLPRSLENIAAFVREKDGKTDEPFFAICTRDDHWHIGNIKLGPINWRHRRGEVSLLIGEKDCWGCGYATEAIALITKFGFETLSLHKLSAYCYEENVGSARAFEKCGYRHEGLLRDHFFIGGKTTGGVILGITLDDYREVLQK